MMTLGNMRDNGVRTLAITCGAIWCNHYAVLDVDAFADDVMVHPSGHAWCARCVVPSVQCTA